MRLIRSFNFAWQGIKICFKTQPNFRIHLGMLAIAIAAGIFFHINQTEWLFIVVCAMSVLVLELINTALEYLCDMVTTDFHPAIKVIKDTSAGAVLISAAGSVVTGLIIFLPKIFALFS